MRAQDPQRDIAVTVRSAGDPLQAAAQVRETLGTELPDQPITDLMLMTQVAAENALLVPGTRRDCSECWG